MDCRTVGHTAECGCLSMILFLFTLLMISCSPVLLLLHQLLYSVRRFRQFWLPFSTKKKQGLRTTTSGARGH
jgi:hypothetical protein